MPGWVGVEEPPPPPPLPGITREEPHPAIVVSVAIETIASSSGGKRRRFAAQTSGRKRKARNTPALLVRRVLVCSRLAVVCDMPVWTVAERVYVPPRVDVVGLTLQVLLAGAPLQASETGPVSPWSELRRSGYVAVAPLAIVTLAAPLVARL